MAAAFPRVGMRKEQAEFLAPWPADKPSPPHARHKSMWVQCGWTRKFDHERVNSWWAGNLNDAFTSKPTSMSRMPPGAFSSKPRSMPMTRANRRELVIGSTLATMLGPLKAAHATAPPASKEAPGIYRYRIGAFEITAL
jgi:hypothetical protein